MKAWWKWFFVALGSFVGGTALAVVWICMLFGFQTGFDSLGLVLTWWSPAIMVTASAAYATFVVRRGRVWTR